MARTAELILRLVDQVTAPARAINQALATVNRATAGIANVGRDLRRTSADMAGISLPMILFGRQAAEQIYEFEKAGNAAQAYGRITEEQREKLEDYIGVLNETSPFNQVEIMQGANELFRAGLKYEQAYGALKGVLDLGAAGDIGIAEAGDLATNIVTSLRLPMETAEQVEASMLRINDVLAYAAANSNADVLQMAQSFKYAGGIATAVGIDAEELATIFMVMARNGIKASEAGVALRSGIVRMLRPTIPAQKALDRLNIDMGEFVTLGDQLSFDDIDAALATFGGSLQGVRGEVEALLGNDLLKRSPQKLTAKIMELVNQEMEGDAADMQVVGEAVVEAIMAGAENVDFIGFIKELNEKGATAVDISQIWDVRQGSRLISLLSQDLEELQEELILKAPGSSAEMAATRLLGIVGVVERFEAATSNLYMAIAESGVLSTVSDLIERFSKLVVHLSEVNPKMLELGTYSLVALAGLAPLGWVLSGLASSAAFLANPITLIAGALGYLAFQNWKGITYFFNSFTRFFNEGLDPAMVDQVSGVIDKMKQWGDDLSFQLDFSDWGKAAGEGAASLANQLPGLLTQLEDLRTKAQPILDAVNPLFQSFSRSVNSMVNAVIRVGTGFGQGVISFADGFLTALDPATVDTMVRFAEWVGKLTVALLDGILTSDRLPAFLESLRGFGTLTADGLDTLVGWIERLVTALEWLATTDAYTIGKTLMDNFVKGLLDGSGPLANIIETVRSLQYALTNGAMGAPRGSGGGGGTSNVPAAQTANGLLPVPQADYGPVPAAPHADGGSYEPGLIVTGEKGAELQIASGRGQIFDADDTRDMLSGKHQRGGDSYVINVYGGSTEEIMRKLTGLLDSKMQRSRSISMQDGLLTE